MEDNKLWFRKAVWTQLQPDVWPGCLRSDTFWFIFKNNRNTPKTNNKNNKKTPQTKTQVIFLKKLHPERWHKQYFLDKPAQKESRMKCLTVTLAGRKFTPQKTMPKVSKSWQWHPLWPDPVPAEADGEFFLHQTARETLQKEAWEELELISYLEKKEKKNNKTTVTHFGVEMKHLIIRVIKQNLQRIFFLQSSKRVTHSHKPEKVLLKGAVKEEKGSN